VRDELSIARWRDGSDVVPTFPAALPPRGWQSHEEGPAREQSSRASARVLRTSSLAAQSAERRILYLWFAPGTWEQKEIGDSSLRKTFVQNDRFRKRCANPKFYQNDVAIGIMGFFCGQWFTENCKLTAQAARGVTICNSHFSFSNLQFPHFASRRGHGAPSLRPTRRALRAQVPEPRRPLRRQPDWLARGHLDEREHLA
jgi:hypothetical protein